jgi:hypothetical protein
MRVRSSSAYVLSVSLCRILYLPQRCLKVKTSFFRMSMLPSIFRGRRTSCLRSRSSLLIRYIHALHPNGTIAAPHKSHAVTGTAGDTDHIVVQRFRGLHEYLFPTAIGSLHLPSEFLDAIPRLPLTQSRQLYLVPGAAVVCMATCWHC